MRCYVEVELDAGSMSEATMAVLHALSEEAPNYHVMSVSAREGVE